VLQGLLQGLLMRNSWREACPLTFAAIIDEIEGGGISCLPSLPARNALSSSSVKASAPARNLTKAFAASPRVGIRDADHDHFLHRGMFIDRLLDHLRIDVEAAPSDIVLLRGRPGRNSRRRPCSRIAGQETVADEPSAVSLAGSSSLW